MTRFLTALVFCLTAAACIPAFTGKILEGQTPFYDPALVGRWYDEDGDRVTISRRDDGYDIASRNQDDEIEHMRALSVRHGEHAYLIVPNDDATPPPDLPPDTKLYTVLRYTIANGALNVSLPSEQGLLAMVNAGALSGPVGHYCTRSTPAEPATTEGVGPPPAEGAQPAAPENPMTCAIFDVTLAQLAGAGAGPFDQPQPILTRRRQR